MHEAKIVPTVSEMHRLKKQHSSKQQREKAAKSNINTSDQHQQFTKSPTTGYLFITITVVVCHSIVE